MFESAGQPVGELIVLNGKRKGTRLPLRPVTVIGSAAGCDVRLTGDGVGLAHCVVGLTAEGPALRAGFSGHTLVNGSPCDEALLADGDELKVGPCVFQVTWSVPAPQLPPPCESLSTEQAAQLAEILDDRQKQLTDHEERLADARAALRIERERVEADREETDRLTREAAALHREATRHRERIKRLAARFVGRIRRKSHAARKELEAERAELKRLRCELAAQTALFGIDRSEFHAKATEARDRLRNAWAELDSQRKRATAEWAEANDFHAKQDAALEARSAEIAAREKAVSEARATLERETAGLRQEAAGLEARIQNARTVVEELEQQREQLRARALAPTAEKEPPAEQRVALDRVKDRDLAAWAAELDDRQRKLDADRATLAAVKHGLDHDAADLADGRRVLAEQVGLLAAARSLWQQAEARTLAEMEELARDLRHREQQLDAREERVIGADTRRREDAYELWQLRLRLEGWQAKLTAVERRWHAERELREAEYAGRVQALSQREAGLDTTLARWEEASEQDRERLRTELVLWADDRRRLVGAAAEFDRQRQEVLGELVQHASRAMAAEQLAAGAVQDGGSDRMKRRLEVLRKRWERTFTRARDEVAERQQAAAGELASLDARYQEFHQLLTDVADREAELTAGLARSEFEGLNRAPAPVVRRVPAAEAVLSGELLVLREEVERMAGVLLAAGVPEVPESHLPWAADEDANADVLPFEGQSRAA
jgi:hypothetical protein